MEMTAEQVTNISRNVGYRGLLGKEAIVVIIKHQRSGKVELNSVLAQLPHRSYCPERFV
jgi:hypothetical protein